MFLLKRVNDLSSPFHFQKSVPMPTQARCIIGWATPDIFFILAYQLLKRTRRCWGIGTHQRTPRGGLERLFL